MWWKTKQFKWLYLLYLNLSMHFFRAVNLLDVANLWIYLPLPWSRPISKSTHLEIIIMVYISGHEGRIHSFPLWLNASVVIITMLTLRCVRSPTYMSWQVRFRDHLYTQTRAGAMIRTRDAFYCLLFAVYTIAAIVLCRKNVDFQIIETFKGRYVGM